MDKSLTMTLMGAAALGAAFCGWRGSRPPNPNKGPRLVPWRPLMVAFTLLALMLLIHLIQV